MRIVALLLLCSVASADNGVYRITTKDTENNLIGQAQCIYIADPAGGDNYILTCNHVVAHDDEFTVHVDDGPQPGDYPLTLVAKNPGLDAAVLRGQIPAGIPRWHLVEATGAVQASVTLREGGSVPCVYNPFPADQSRNEAGLVGKLNIACKSGDSGGAVVANGRLLGMVCAGGDGQNLQMRCYGGQCYQPGVFLQSPIVPAYRVPQYVPPQMPVRSHGSTSIVRSQELTRWIGGISAADMSPAPAQAVQSSPPAASGCRCSDQFAAINERLRELESRPVSVGQQGPQGERGPQGMMGPAGMSGPPGLPGRDATDEQVAKAVAEWMATHQPTVDQGPVQPTLAGTGLLAVYVSPKDDKTRETDALVKVLEDRKFPVLSVRVKANSLADVPQLYNHVSRKMTTGSAAVQDELRSLISFADEVQ